MKHLKELALQGGFAKCCAQVLDFLIRAGSLVVLARLLEPEDFGLVGMATAVIGVFSLFKNAGLWMVTVQRETITDEQISTLFWINLSVGALLVILSLVIAPILVSFYHEPRLWEITVALGIGFLFSGAGVQHSAILQRRMAFGVISMVDILSLIISSAMGIAIAMRGHGYWALVSVPVITPAVSTVGFWLVAGWVPGMPCRGREIGAMIRFGGKATLGGVITYYAYNLDKILLGRYLGPDAVGVYGRAYYLATIPSESLNSATAGVLFSALSRLQNDPIRLKSYFLKSYELLFSLALPVAVTCALFADDIIVVALGEKWKEAGVILRLLTPIVCALVLIYPIYIMLVAFGRIDRHLRSLIAFAPLLISAYVIGLPYGVTGVAAAYSIVMILWVVPYIAWCIHGTMISLGDIASPLLRPLLSGAVAGVCGFVWEWNYAEFLSPVLRIVCGGGILVAVYLWMLLWVMGMKSFYFDLLNVLRRSVGSIGN